MSLKQLQKQQRNKMPLLEEYKFGAATPDEELMVVCRMLSEVGGYASSIADRSHQLYSRKCMAAQRRVEKELVRRRGTDIMGKVFETPSGQIDDSDLTLLTVDELEKLYRQRPLRVKRRLAEGLTILTRFYETRIVNELKRRTPSTPLEQLQKDYCIRTNRQELENISTLLRKPMGAPCFNPMAGESLPALASEIERLSRFSTVMEHEALHEYVDLALIHLRKGEDMQQGAMLAKSLIEAGWNKAISCPAWVREYLLDAIRQWKRHPEVADTEMAVPLLTAYWETNDAKYERMARRIINRSYRLATSILTNPTDRESNIEHLALKETEHSASKETGYSALIEALHLSRQCCDFASRYSVRKIAAAWNRLSSTLNLFTLPTSHLIKLLEIANEIEDFAPISDISKTAMIETLATRASHDDSEAEIYMKGLAPTPALAV